VTGHTGFKGSWLCLWLAQMGARVTGVALPPPTRPSLFRAARVEDMLERSIMLDIRNRAGFARALRKIKPQIVIHMAAQPLVRDSYAQPVMTYETNIIGTINLLEAIRATAGVRVVLNVTTDKCYDNLERSKGYSEGDPLGGYDPYSSSKACSEIVTAAYRSSFFNPKKYNKHGVAIATVRAGNVIGGGDWSKDRLVPDCIRAFVTAKDIILRNPDAVRPWQHVLEPLSGYLILSERLFKDGKRFSSAWNFGPDNIDVWTVKRVANTICHEWGGTAHIRISHGSYPHETGLLMLDIAKAKKALGWKPRWNNLIALERTVNWYKAYYNRKDVRSLCLAQIAEYSNS